MEVGSSNNITTEKGPEQSSRDEEAHNKMADFQSDMDKSKSTDHLATRSSHDFCNGEEEELEEGELKDDDDDSEVDDDSKDEAEGKGTASKDSSDDSETNEKKTTVSRGSSVSGHSIGSTNKISTRVGEVIDYDVRKFKSKTSSTRSSTPQNEHISRPFSFRSRHGSDSRHSSRSQSRSKRNLSPANQQARLVTMRAKLLEAKAREIEMKFQKNKTHLTSASPISSTLSLTPCRNLKTTIARPPITYSENPNPFDLSPDPRIKSRSVNSSKSEAQVKSKVSKKSSKKRKKKSSSSSKKKKRSKASDNPKKNDPSDMKPGIAASDIAFDAVDHQGPRTPPDNQVLTLDDEQVEWPSYLIKMTTTLPSISYSVNPDSVACNNPPERSNTADLNQDFTWYYNYFINTFDMDKSQAQHQARSIITASSCYNDDDLYRWLEQQGYSMQMEGRDDDAQNNTNGEAANAERANLSIRPNEPAYTILKSLNEITLPNGHVLPRGTIQKIVHPYPRPERVVPDITSTFCDLN